MMVYTRIFGTTEEDIKQAAEIIKEGGLVAFPTETVYGLGANALDTEAVGKVYAAKGRPSDNPMIVHIANKEDVARLTPSITEDMEKLMEAFWPGPLTMVVAAKEEIPRVTTGGLDTVAVRMPASDVALSLIREAGVPVAAPSANLSGRPSPTTAMHVYDDLKDRIDAVIQGDTCKVGIESTVVDMTEEAPMILRPGIVTQQEIADVLSKEVALDPALLEKPDMFNNEGLLEEGREFKPKSPGMKYKHYAPKAEMVIFSGEDPEKVRLAIATEKMTRVGYGQKVGVLIFEKESPEDIAREFFGQLRAFDKIGVDVIFAAAIKEDGVGLAVMNRMFKSAGYNIREIK